MARKLDDRPLIRIADNLWCNPVNPKPGEMGRTTVIVLDGGRLAMITARRMGDAAMTDMDAKGRMAYIIVPNTLHDSDAAWVAERYPAAKVLAPTAHFGKLRKQKKTRVDGSVESDWPADLDAHLKRFPLAGTRMHESLFLHAPTRTLIVTDLAFNLFEADYANGVERWLMRKNRATQGLGPSWLAQKFFVNDHDACGESLASMLKAWDFDRIVVGHGHIVDSGGKEAFRKAFEMWLPTA